MRGQIASGMSMRSRQQCVLLLAACVLLCARQIQAAHEVTFEIVASFDYPGGLDTAATGINDRGTVVGTFTNDLNQVQSFVRFADGTFSDPIIYPGSQSTYLSDLNNTGTMCGSYLLNGAYHGFFLSGSSFTNFDLDTSNTLVRGVNDAGNFSGTTIEQGFVSIDGTVTMFDIPGQAIIDAYSINSLNQVVGGAVAVHGFEVEYSFLRGANGKLVWPIQAPGFRNTGMFGVDDKGRMVGFVTSVDAPTQAVFLRASHRFAIFAYPGAISTEFTDINNHGQICGEYDSPDGKQHGFIALVRDDD
jgi:probable HAF family extracellular repeat protein